jgi:large subunit ribosomal protein L24e
MVEKRDCSFCGSAIEPGTGLMYIRRDGTRHTFCSSKCRRNLLDLKRVPRTVKWTQHYIKGLGKASAVQSKKQVPAKPKQVAAAATSIGGAATETAPAPKAGAKPAKPKAASPKGGSAKEK